jgi:uncharacterized protein YdaU (DUF1376 family)
MNYYDRHIGDFIKDTLGLTMLEDGAYNRLLDQIYQTERPLPSDKKEVYRLARANSSAERKAVDYVLGKFFELAEDGYMQKRAQAAIEEYWDREPTEQGKRDNANERQKRSRERRRYLFEQLRAHGVTPEFNASMKTLESELSRVTSSDSHTQRHNPVTRDDTTTHTPDTNTHAPGTTPPVTDQPETGACDSVTVTPAAVLSKAMRDFQVSANPSDPRLMALAAQGVTAETVRAACEDAKRSKPNERIPPAYVFSILERWAKDAASLRAGGATQPRASPQQASNANMQRLNERLNGARSHDPDPRIIDINDRPAREVG